MKTTHYFFTNSHEPWFRGMTAHWGWCIGILVSQIGQLLVWFQHRLSWFSSLLLVVTLYRLHCFCHTHSEASSVLWIGNLFPQSYKYRSYSIILVSICSHIVRKKQSLPHTHFKSLDTDQGVYVEWPMVLKPLYAIRLQQNTRG